MSCSVERDIVELVENHWTMYVSVCFWTLFRSTVRVSPLPRCVDDCSFVGSFETRKRDPSTFVLFKILFQFLGFLAIPNEFKDWLLHFFGTCRSLAVGRTDI